MVYEGKINGCIYIFNILPQIPFITKLVNKCELLVLAKSPLHGERPNFFITAFFSRRKPTTNKEMKTWH